MLALPFFLFVFFTIEVALLFTGDLMLDSAVDDVGRQVRTGQLDTGDMTKAKFREIVCANTPVLIDCAKLRIDLRTYDTYAQIDPNAPAAGTEKFELGGPYQIMALRVYYDWPLLSAFVRKTVGGSDTRLLAGVAAFRTEVYR